MILRQNVESRLKREQPEPQEKKKEKNFSYYDGPVKDSGRTAEEIEKAIEKEKERCDKMTSWDEAYEH